MAATIDTQYGKVIQSDEYYSQNLLCMVINLTLVKSNNNGNGWGISRECPAQITLTPEFITMFAHDAAQVI